MNRMISGYSALILENKLIDWGLRPFRAFDICETYNGFSEFIKEK